MGLLNPGFEPSLEVEARGSPDVLDLGVAILSGFIAAYALGRPGVANTLAGVAIAAALVPPLCVVGIGLTNDQPAVAANAAVLLLTNLVAIILSVAGAFLLLGVRGAGTGDQLSGWVRRAIIIMFMVTIVLLLPLISNVVEQKRRGQAKPLTYPVAAHVQEAVEEYLDDKVEPGNRYRYFVRIALAAETPYREGETGQILEEGITEAGAMSSFIAAGTAYATHHVNTIPMFLFYSMFGFQRTGDEIWAFGDARGRGFMLGATGGRIIVQHILPNVLHLVIINFSLMFVYAVKSEVILSFLGLGIQDGVSWGLMLAESSQEVLAGHFGNFLGAGTALFILLMGFNLLSDALQDALDNRRLLR